jgi:hypothetical protein
VIGVITVVVAYLLTRELAGRGAALIAAGILALDPLQIGWSRSDIHPHGATAWPALLLAWATLRMLSERRTGWCVAVAALMGLTWHQYPSGQLAVGVPLIVLAVFAVTDRGLLRDLGWRVTLVGAGLLLWFAGHPLAQWVGSGQQRTIGDYLASLGTRVAGTDIGAAPFSSLEVVHLANNTSDLVRGVFVELPHMFHQTFIPQVVGLSYRSLPWLVAAFAVVGLMMLATRLPAAGPLVVCALTVTSAMPLLFSEVPYIKRAAVLFPVLEIVAAVAMAAVARAVWGRFGRLGRPLLLATMVAGFVAWAAVCAHLWFSERQYRWGTPPELAMVDAAARQLAPRTLMLAGLWDSYMEGKLTYLLLDELRRPELQPVVWFTTSPSDDTWQRLITRPTAAIDALEARPWFSLWSGLDRRMPQIRAQDRWQRVVYLIEEREDTDADIERIRSFCPDLTVHELQPGEEPKHWMRLAVCDDHTGLPRQRGTRRSSTSHSASASATTQLP